MSGIGHNQGPTMEPGFGWRRHAWGKARAELMPKLPIEVVRLRINRARELGLDYKTYAGIRAGTGRDVIGFLFSTNALRMLNRNLHMPEDRREQLSVMRNCARIAVVQPPLDADLVAQAHDAVLEGASPAPLFIHGWDATRTRIAHATRLAQAPASAVLLVGDTALERTWAQAGRLAGYVPAETFFAGAAR
ncbi:hypothetical protein [Actibacterium ureilyticum]|uniref:hypothetical protein n=1 Tax=Actibacterium ureilyticum TaxID=1590614 RepID=UPI000BAAAFB2|nr:hypothetical protein [Actibacterium ureilyticum]